MRERRALTHKVSRRIILKMDFCTVAFQKFKSLGRDGGLDSKMWVRFTGVIYDNLTANEGDVAQN